MHTETNDRPPPVNHIFVDYENVHTLDSSIIGNKTIHITLLLGAKKAKLDATVVEKLMQHVATVEMIRLTSLGPNALDFALAYYLGRAVQSDPCGYFHIVSKDKGYDPLIEHLRSKHVRARRHDNFSTLTFSVAAKPATAVLPVAALPIKAPAKPKAQSSHLETLEALVLVHLRKPTTKLPGTKKKLVSYLVAHLGHKVTEAEVSDLVEMMSQAGHVVIGEKDRVTYHFEQA